jgi:hypothetical protein
VNTEYTVERWSGGAALHKESTLIGAAGSIYSIRITLITRSDLINTVALAR